MHPVYGVGEVTALIEPKKMDVLFPDRMRRLIHSREWTGRMPAREVGRGSG